MIENWKSGCSGESVFNGASKDLLAELTILASLIFFKYWLWSKFWFKYSEVGLLCLDLVSVEWSVDAKCLTATLRDKRLGEARELRHLDKQLSTSIPPASAASAALSHCPMCNPVSLHPVWKSHQISRGSERAWWVITVIIVIMFQGWQKDPKYKI